MSRLQGDLNPWHRDAGGIWSFVAWLFIVYIHDPQLFYCFKLVYYFLFFVKFRLSILAHKPTMRNCRAWRKECMCLTVYDCKNTYLELPFNSKLVFFCFSTMNISFKVKFILCFHDFCCKPGPRNYYQIIEKNNNLK